jgi:hypothetical protein|nr:hypothetical protein DBT41_13070 [Aerococcus urinae]
MGEGSMTALTTYRLRAESSDALWQMLADASRGKARPYAWETGSGRKAFDLARVRLPWAEVAQGEPVEETDPDTGETVITTPEEPTGFWLSDVVLVDGGDDELAAAAIG